MTRDEAIAAGKRRYLGKPCVRGHDSWRCLLRDECDFIAPISKARLMAAR